MGSDRLYVCAAGTHSYRLPIEAATCIQGRCKARRRPLDIKAKEYFRAESRRLLVDGKKAAP